MELQHDLALKQRVPEVEGRSANRPNSKIRGDDLRLRRAVGHSRLPLRHGLNGIQGIRSKKAKERTRGATLGFLTPRKISIRV